MRIARTYRYRMLPTPEQERLMLLTAEGRNSVFNWAAEQSLSFYERTGETIKPNALSRMLTELKQQAPTAWLRECNAKALQQGLKDFCDARTAFFQRYKKMQAKASMGFFSNLPRSDNSRTSKTFRIPQNVRLVGSSVRLETFGFIKIRLSRMPRGVIKNATITRNSCEQWHVSLCCEMEAASPIGHPVPEDRRVGIDVGVHRLATLSNGEIIGAPHLAEGLQERVAAAQRRLACCQRGSRRYEKARLRLARLKLKEQNRRQDFLHKITARLVRDYDVICVEDLTPKELAARSGGKRLYDTALSEFRRQIEYKAQSMGKQTVAVNRWFASSKLCSNCGSKNEALRLEDRVWTCERCGMTHDRDLNAAVNILREGCRTDCGGAHRERSKRQDSR